MGPPGLGIDIGYAGRLAGLAEQAVMRHPGNFAEAVGEIGKPQVLVHLPEPVRGGFRDIAESLLAVVQPFAVGDATLQDGEQLGRIDRPGKQIIGPGAPGLENGFQLGEGGHHDADDGGPPPPQIGDQLESTGGNAAPEAKVDQTPIVHQQPAAPPRPAGRG